MFINCDDVPDRLFINDVPLKVVGEYKYVGVILDKFLSFDKHIMHMKRKIAGKLAVLNKIRLCVDKHSRILL